MQDLWVVNTSGLQAQQIPTTGETPMARVGHAALLIGNAFIGMKITKLEPFLLLTLISLWW